MEVKDAYKLSDAAQAAAAELASATKKLKEAEKKTLEAREDADHARIIHGEALGEELAAAEEYAKALVAFHEAVCSEK